MDDELSERFNKAMHVKFGYLGAPEAVPICAVTAQMLRDLVNFQSSLPVSDQWMIKTWIKTLTRFAEVEDSPTSANSNSTELSSTPIFFILLVKRTLLLKFIYL